MDNNGMDGEFKGHRPLGESAGLRRAPRNTSKIEAARASNQFTEIIALIREVVRPKKQDESTLEKQRREVKILSNIEIKSELRGATKAEAEKRPEYYRALVDEYEERLSGQEIGTPDIDD